MARLQRTAVCAALVAALGCSAQPPIEEPPAKPCTSFNDCPSGQVCLDPVGKACAAAASCLCKPIAVTGCTKDSECSDGQRCLSDGSCGDFQCETTLDCCPGGMAGCTQECQNFECVGTICNPGDNKSCFVECHRGLQQCVNGDWSACDAPPLLSEETCGDGIDNDCNGKTDEPPKCIDCTGGQTQPCTGACGEGQQHCQEDGTWGACDAPSDCTCSQGETTTKPCGSCGEAQGTCGPEGTWTFSEICTGEGPCAANALDEQGCGACGQQTRTCSAECSWGDWTECVDAGECQPEEEQEEPCEGCGSGKKRTCTQECAWGPWSECSASLGCSPGDTKGEPCGKCGTQGYTCSNACEWQPTGLCSGTGPCTPDEVEEDDCGNCGSKSRSCLNNCQWTPWTSCVGAGPCAIGESQEQACGPNTNQGLCEYGTEVRTCNVNCQWNTFGSCLGAVNPKTEICGSGQDEDCDGYSDTLADDYESNDTCGTCYDLGTDPDVTFTATFDSSEDQVDYFCFTAHDGVSVLGPEHIKVSVKKQSNGIDADLFLYEGNADCASGSATKSAVGANQDKELDWSEDFASDDGGTWIIKVQNYGQSGCYHTYEITVNGLN